MNDQALIDLGVGSHIPTLSVLLGMTNGPIVECGMGTWSTPLLNAHANYGRRLLLSLETDETWMAKFEHLRSDNHLMQIISDWRITDAIMKVPRWSVAFIDCSPGEVRVPLALRLKEHADFIVCHDTEADFPPAAGNYGWRHLEGVFKHKTVCGLWRPWTTVYSDVQPFAMEEVMTGTRRTA